MKDVSETSVTSAATETNARDDSKAFVRRHSVAADMHDNNEY